jgi:hypothetical protein
MLKKEEKFMNNFKNEKNGVQLFVENNGKKTKDSQSMKTFQEFLRRNFPRVLLLGVGILFSFRGCFPARASTLAVSPPAQNCIPSVSAATPEVEISGSKNIKYGRISVGGGLRFYDAFRSNENGDVSLFHDLKKVNCNVQQAQELQTDIEEKTRYFLDSLYDDFQPTMKKWNYVRLFLTNLAELPVDSRDTAAGLSVERGSGRSFAMGRDNLRSVFKNGPVSVNELQRILDLSQTAMRLVNEKVARENQLTGLVAKIEPMRHVFEQTVDPSTIHISAKIAPVFHIASKPLPHINMSVVGMMNYYSKDISLGFGKAYVFPAEIGGFRAIASADFGARFHPSRNSRVHYNYAGLGMHMFLGIGVGI